ncbi:hypothetical protein FOL47_008210 [Perkinsus chesapeaki]|uniref:Uncharacterized protein n=1 Tax=Perkinsus chesapeaki TaxID=330153 RepID=A0A7J6LFH2_PERCH|nr:hypothetical protein FOL47_008210 [Perkinsus chesapeaki]
MAEQPGLTMGSTDALTTAATITKRIIDEQLAVLSAYPQHLITAAQMPAKMTALETTTSDLKLQVYTLDTLRACRKLWRLACELHTSSSCMRVGAEQLEPLDLTPLQDLEDRISQLVSELDEINSTASLVPSDEVTMK